MISGKAWVFGNDIDTDQIIPSQYLLLPAIEEMKKYAFETLMPDFPKEVNKGDIIVAGENFGCGSSREQAPRILKELGVSAIIAKSFARIFYRNAINIGLPAVVCNIENVKKGDEIHVDINKGFVKVGGKEYSATKFPEHLMRILDAGGMIEYINKGGTRG